MAKERSSRRLRAARVGAPMRNAFAPLAAALLALAALPAAGQTALSLADLNARTGAEGDFAPTHTGEHVSIRGVASGRAFHFPGYTLLAIQDSGGGGILEVARGDDRLESMRAGDRIEADGDVANLNGASVLLVGRIAAVGRAPEPTPVAVSIQDITSFPGCLRFLGRLIRVQGQVRQTDETTSGFSILIGPASNQYKIFFPAVKLVTSKLNSIEKGDSVGATGVALQYCPAPPYDRFFELLVDGPSAVQLEGQSVPFPPLALALALCVVLFISFVIWTHERRLRKQRERLHRTYQLGEEILGAGSLDAILNRISEVLPAILGVTRVHLYVHNRGAKTLEAHFRDNREPVSISLAAPPGGTQAGAVACFHYRTLLAIPDIGKSPFPMAAGAEGAPKSLLLVPMFAQAEVMGVLELDQDDRARDFTADEQALAQHLGNQIGVAIRLLDRRNVQEQLFRTEKMAAVGRLISEVVSELQTPLASISDLAAKALRAAARTASLRPSPPRRRRRRAWYPGW